MNEQAFTR